MSILPAHPLARPKINRRDFLRLIGLSLAGWVANSCAPGTSAPATSTISQTTTSTAQSLPTTPLRPQVAIGQIRTYERAAIEQQVKNLIEQLGGLGDTVKPGDKVGIKPNLTGGVSSGLVENIPAEESYVTHPEVVRALIKQVQAAGAKEIFIVESVYEWESYTQWGYQQIADELGVKLIDLNSPAPYKDFVEISVGPNHHIYESFKVNPILKDINVFMSVSKMKNHQLAGVTHTMKNLYGLVPYALYRLNSNDRYRSAFHGGESETRQRLPRIIVDINRARPIHFSLIDGIKSLQGGEGPWIPSAAPISAGVLIAGKNPVSTDSVATAIMGHDPRESNPNQPFIRCDNHIQLAAEAGLGTNRLDEIEVRGAPISQVLTRFTPAP